MPGKELKRIIVPAVWLLMVMAVVSTPLQPNAYAGVYRYDGPYKGKVIDAESGEPIEGAVVVGVWHRIHPNVAGWNSEFYDAVETLTDKDGYFTFRGLGPLFFSNIDEVIILIFKTGYDHLGSCLWVSLKEDLLLRHIISWDKDVPTIPLKKITKEQSRKDGTPSVGAKVPEDKIRLFTEEINRWRKWQGFKS